MLVGGESQWSLNLWVRILNNRQGKKKFDKWLDTQSINLFLYVQGHCVHIFFFFKFCTVFLMRNHFILAGTVFSSVRTFVGSILYKWKNNGAEIWHLYFKTPKLIELKTTTMEISACIWSSVVQNTQCKSFRRNRNTEDRLKCIEINLEIKIHRCFYCLKYILWKRLSVLFEMLNCYCNFMRTADLSHVFSTFAVFYILL